MELPVDETDIELIRRTLDGNQAAFSVLVERYADAVYAVVVDVLRKPGDADDVVQECFVRAYKSLATFRQEARFGTWLQRIAYNLAVTRSRQQVRRGETFTTEDQQILEARGADDPLPDEIVANKDLAQKLAAHMERLPEHYRLALTLYYYEGYSYQEIAEVVDRPVNTVKVHMRRAKAFLKRLLLEQAEPVEWVSDADEQQE